MVVRACWDVLFWLGFDLNFGCLVCAGLLGCLRFNWMFSGFVVLFDLVID